MHPASRIRIAAPYAAALLIYGALAGLMLAMLVSVNGGHLVYSLDDAYIHLAMSEQIAQGHYGVNSGEFSAASSSILWPFLLAPFASASFHAAMPLILNLLATALSILLLAWFFDRWVIARDVPGRSVAIAGLAALFPLFLNYYGLIFTGMEHPLQVAATLAGLLGLLLFLEDGRCRWWFLLAVVMAPLVRYENLALSGLILLILLSRRRWLAALAPGAVLVFALAGFSIFLLSLGLDWLPGSVLVKSDSARLAEGGGGVLEAIGRFAVSVSNNMRQSLASNLGVLVAAVCGLLLWPLMNWRNDPRRGQLALAGLVAGQAHLALGHFSAWQRYEIYILTALVVIVAELYRDALSGFFRVNRPARGLLLVLCVGAPVFWQALSVTIATPLGASNIYEQQLQMHRYAADFLRQPVAVNDLGAVAYRNDYFVLDLLGLGSEPVRRALYDPADPHTVAEIVARYRIPVVMGYAQWIGGALPPGYRAMARLHLAHRQLTAGDSTVTFYLGPMEDPVHHRELLRRFGATLPPGVRLETLL